LASGNSSLAAYGDLFDGTQLSDCPLPCTTKNTETKHISDNIGPRNLSTLLLTFSSKVLVTRTDFPEFSLASFLSEVGGSMGLWLGWASCSLQFLNLPQLSIKACPNT
jgi:hypothetical protein